MIFVVLLVRATYTSIGHRRHIAMKYKGYKVSLIDWILITIFRNDIQLNKMITCRSHAHAMYIAGTANIPLHALVKSMDSYSDGILLIYRFSWLPISENMVIYADKDQTLFKDMILQSEWADI